MEFTLKITCNNDAFQDGNMAAEVVTLLRHAAMRVEAGRTDAPIIDTNGATVGAWTFVDEVGTEHARVEVNTRAQRFEDYANYATFRVCVDGWNNEPIYNAILKLTEECLSKVPNMTDQTLGRNIKDAMRRWAQDAVTGTDDRERYPSLVRVEPSPSSTFLLRDWHRTVPLTDINEDDLGAQARQTFNDTRE